MEIIERAPAKINLGLDILFKRQDGYHELETILTSIDLADRLHFTSLAEDVIRIETNNSFLPLDQKNHIYLAAEQIKKTCQISKGVHIFLEKNIPVAAGLGGGSSDCAATLRGLNRMWQLQLSLEELKMIGNRIGSDVSYCLSGGTAFASGRGEMIMHLPDVPQCWVILAKPQVSVSTSSVFRELSLPDVAHLDMQGLKQAIIQQDYAKMLPKMGNVLETVTSKRYPLIQKMKKRMMHYGADIALMSGSGPTVFALCIQKSRALRVYNGLRGFCQEVYMIRTLK